MHLSPRLIKQCLIVVAVLFVALQIRSQFCLYTNKCEPFYLTEYLPRKPGDKSFEVVFNIINYSDKFEFYPGATSLWTQTNKVSEMAFTVRNVSTQDIVFKPNLEISPSNLTDYFRKIHCLCSGEYKVAAGQILNFKLKFLIDPNISDEDEFEESIKDNAGSRAIVVVYRAK